MKTIGAGGLPTIGAPVSSGTGGDVVITPDVKYESYTAASGDTSITDILPEEGEEDVIYRVGNWDGTEVDATKMSEYAWDGSDYTLLRVVDSIGEVFDISAYNASGGTLATYADLAAALGTSGANVPEGVRKGGMSVKYVQSSDNNYVQFRYMSSDAATVATFTNVANWQGVDAEPTAESQNLVTSGGVEKRVLEDSLEIANISIPVVAGQELSYILNFNFESNRIIVIRVQNRQLLTNLAVLFRGSTTISQALNEVSYYVLPANLNCTSMELLATGGNVLDSGELIINISYESKYQDRVRIANPYLSYCFNDCIQELYVTDVFYSSLRIQSYQNQVLLFQTNSADNICARSQTGISENNVIYPISITKTNDSEHYPIGKVVAYIIFKDIQLFNKLSGSGAFSELNLDVVTSKHYCPTISDYLLNIDVSSQFTAVNAQLEDLDGRLEDTEDQLESIQEQLQQTTVLTPLQFIDTYYINTKITGPSASYDTSVAVYNIEGLVGTVNLSAETISNIYFRLWGTFDALVLNSSVAIRQGDYVTVATSDTIQLDGTEKYLCVACKKSNHITSCVLTSDVIPAMQEQVNALGSEVAEIEQRLQGKVEVILPDNLQAVVGDTLQLFFRGMVLAVNPYNYDIVVKCNKGAQYERYFEYTPVVADIGTTNFEIEVFDNEGNLIAEKSCTLTTVAEPTSPQSQKNIICLGDSLTSGGQWPAEAARRLIGSGGTPSGKALSNITFCGSLTKDLAGYFGAGGWTWSSYTHKGSDAYRFTVSGVTTVNFRDVYSNDGYEFTVQEVNITNGSGTILCSVSAGGSPTASGTLSIISGNGDAEITFSASSYDVQNPLWDETNNKMSFVPYANEYCNNQIDVVCVLLSWNSQSPFTKTFSSVIAEVKTFADTLHSEFPSAKLKIMGIQAPNQKDLHGYGANGGYADKYGMTYTALMLKKAYQDFANSTELSGTSNDAYNTFVEFIDVASQFDSEYNMQMGAKKVNTRNATTETIGTNGVHPAESGYMQIADAVYRNIVANYCQST